MQKSKVECLIEAFFLMRTTMHINLCIYVARERGRDIEIESCLIFFRTLEIHNHDTWKLEDAYPPTLRDWHMLRLSFFNRS